MEGVVNAAGQPVLQLQLKGPGVRLAVDAILDTGFSGSLTLSPDAIAKLGLISAGTRRARLGDGQIVEFAVYLATLEWFGTDREITVLSSDAGTLIGMALLQGTRLTMEVIPGGKVVIVPLVT